MWKGNHFLSKETSNLEILGTLNMNSINDGDILYLFFLNPSGNTGAVALSIIFKHHKYFTAIVSVNKNCICTIVFRFDDDGKFYCESIDSSDNYSYLHIIEITKLSSDIIHFF